MGLPPITQSSAAESPEVPSSSSQELPLLARTSPVSWLLFLTPAVLGIAADLWSKAYAFPAGDLQAYINAVAAGEKVGDPGLRGFDPPSIMIPGVLGFRTTVNYGAVFGVGQHRGWIFILFSILALGAIVWVFATSFRKQRWLHLALGLILGGAIGNLYDRLAYGFVRDFMIFYNVSWYQYIFNVADVLLCIGVPLLMICWVFTPAKPMPTIENRDVS